MLKSHTHAGYYPITLNDENMSIEQLKEQRSFLQFIIDLKYNPIKLQYLLRLFDPEGLNGSYDNLFKTNNEKTRLWSYHITDIIEMKNAISLEIMHRNSKHK